MRRRFRQELEREIFELKKRFEQAGLPKQRLPLNLRNNRHITPDECIADIHARIPKTLKELRLGDPTKAAYFLGIMDGIMLMIPEDPEQRRFYAHELLRSIPE